MSDSKQKSYPEYPGRANSVGYPNKEEKVSYAALLGYETQKSIATKAPQPPLGFTPQDNTSRPAATPVFGAKDHVVAALLAIFLGALGVHKFYLGYNSAGFIMLAVTVLGSIFTLGLAFNVMAIISIVEGFIYLSKSQTEFERIYVVNSKEWF